jgi:hypothetical protein
MVGHWAAYLLRRTTCRHAAKLCLSLRCPGIFRTQVAMMPSRPMRNTAGTALLAVTLAAIIVPRAARADDEQTRRRTFEQARTAMQAGRWEEARTSYLQLWNDRRTYDVALQLGQAEYNLKRMRDAAEHLAYGLMLLPPREKPETAERSRQILALSKQQVGALDLRVKNKGADVIVDGKLVAEAPLVTEIFLDPGEHRFEVRLDGHASEAFTVQIDAGQTKGRSIELKTLVGNDASRQPAQSLEKPQPKPAAKAPLEPAPGPLAYTSWAPAVVGGIVAIAGLSAGIGFQLVRNARADENLRIRKSLDRPNRCNDPGEAYAGDCSRLTELASDYDSFGRLELISFLVGGAALIGTGTYFLIARPDKGRPTSQAHVGPMRFTARLARSSASLQLMADF